MEKFPIEDSIVRIKTENGKVVGTGFLVSDDHVLTCAHVILKAWEDLSKEKSPPVLVDFPTVDPKTDLTAEIVILKNPNIEDDIACLKLSDPKPKGAKPAYLKIANDLVDHRFRTAGFPDGYNDLCVNTVGVIRGKASNNLIQIEDDKVPGARIRQGFSGAPVWDDIINGVVAMISQENTEAQEKMALAIPSYIIMEVCPQLKVENTVTLTEKTDDPFLPDNSKITKLNIDDTFLDKLYEEALNKAKKLYDDAQLSYFYLSVLPFFKANARINCRFTFYSKWAEKTCILDWNQSTQDWIHSLPDKPAKNDISKRILTIPPWKNSPLWLNALDKIYKKIEPLSSVEQSWYFLGNIFSSENSYWYFWFLDGQTGNEYNYYWDGKGLEETNILNYWNYVDPFCEQKDFLLPDNTQITKINVTDESLEGLYSEACKKAKEFFNDAQFYKFRIWVNPFMKAGYRGSICFDFYSKKSIRLLNLYWEGIKPEWSTTTQNLSGDLKNLAICLPWKENSLWLQALDKIYTKSSNLFTKQLSNYQVETLTSFDGKLYWRFFFKEENGKEHCYYWDGIALEEANIKNGWSFNEPFPEGFSLIEKEKITTFLDKRYKEALKKAIDLQNDAQLSDFNIHVCPYPKQEEYLPRISGQFSFYSKWTDKISEFSWYGNFDECTHSNDKRSKFDFERKILEGLPWKDTPMWMQVIDRIYSKIGPLSISEKTYYSVGMSNPFLNKEYSWCFMFFDGLSENYKTVYWDGKGLNENNFKIESN